MRLAVSNIAWPIEADALVAEALRNKGVTGVELAPTKYWPNPLEATVGQLKDRRQWWEDRGLPIVSMQALLYGRNDLNIFGDDGLRVQTTDYLCRIIDLAAILGATELVFGSPKNRQRGSIPLDQAKDIACAFFRTVGRHACSKGVAVCLEANPLAYNCDFIVNSNEAIQFVEQVNQTGFGLHLDTGGMMLANDSPEATLLSAGKWWRHFHISEPYLAPIGSGNTPHQLIHRGLKRSGYNRWLSIEMKQTADENWFDMLMNSIDYVREIYQSIHVSADRVA